MKEPCNGDISFVLWIFSRIFELFYVRVCLWKSKWSVMGQIAG